MNMAAIVVILVIQTVGPDYLIYLVTVTPSDSWTHAADMLKGCSASRLL